MLITLLVIGGGVMSAVRIRSSSKGKCCDLGLIPASQCVFFVFHVPAYNRIIICSIRIAGPP
jgi:hypothetical protein